MFIGALAYILYMCSLIYVRPSQPPRRRPAPPLPTLFPNHPTPAHTSSRAQQPKDTLWPLGARPLTTRACAWLQIIKPLVLVLSGAIGMGAATLWCGQGYATHKPPSLLCQSSVVVS